MKRMIIVFSSIMILFFGSIAYVSSTPAIDPSKPAYELVFSVPVASGEGKIAYTPEVEDFEDRGPKSFAVGSNGQFFILDTIDHEVEVFDPNGLSLYTISTPENKEFFDIEVNDRGHVFLLNDLGEIYEYQDRELVQIMSYDQSERVSGLSLSKNREITLFMDGQEKGLTSGELAKGRLGYTGQRKGKHIELSNGNKTIVVEYQFVPAGTYPLVETADGETFVLEQEALIGKSLYIETRVGKYDQAGRLTGSALALPLDRYAVQVPYKFIYVTQQGKVYQMVLGKQTVDLYELFFTDGKRTNITPQVVESINPMDISAFLSPERWESRD